MLIRLLNCYPRKSSIWVHWARKDLGLGGILRSYDLFAGYNKCV